MTFIGGVNVESELSERFGTVGGGSFPDIGTFADFIVVEKDEVIEIPEHLSFEQAAAWPCAGVTAWRYAAGLRRLRYRND